MKWARHCPVDSETEPCKLIELRYVSLYASVLVKMGLPP